MTAEGRGARLRVRDDATSDEVREAARALAARLSGQRVSGRPRDILVETIDGERAAASPHAAAMREAGFRSTGSGLRYYTGLR
jgi:hypothetical protein